MKSAFIKTGWIHLLSLAGFVLITYFIPSQRHDLIVLNYLVLFLLFTISYWKISNDQELKFALYASILFRFCTLFALPVLSDDFYRFVWDGQLMSSGNNPYLSLPSELNMNPEIFNHLNSPDYYTVYPPVTQFFFGISSGIFPHSLMANVVLLKFFIFIFEMGSIVILYKLLKHFQLHPKNILLYALNPLVVIELCGNLHFEAAMIFFTLLMIWLLVKNKFSAAGISFAGAIAVKLNPLMLLPFLFFRMKLKNLGIFLFSSFLILFLVFLPFYTPETFENIFSSLRKYYQYFEFNGSIYNIVRWIEFQIRGWNPIDNVGKYLAGISAISILAFSAVDFRKQISTLSSRLMFALCIYFLFSTTVHPWYITPVIALSVLTNFRFTVIWSLLISLSYLFYADASPIIKSTILWLEYSIVISVFLFELFIRQKFILETRLLSIRSRAAIKLKRIIPLLKKNEKFLDIGCGNGGVCIGIKNAGIELTTVDVKNKSFFSEIQPIIYDGRKLPFPDQSFDITTILTVLHHINNPVEIIREAKRVSKRIIIMEDIYSNVFQKRITFFMDSLVNLEFKNHPHSNKTDAEWKNIFAEEKLKIESVRYHRVLIIFRQVTYVLSAV